MSSFSKVTERDLETVDERSRSTVEDRSLSTVAERSRSPADARSCFDSRVGERLRSVTTRPLSSAPDERVWRRSIWAPQLSPASSSSTAGSTSASSSGHHGSLDHDQ